VRRRAFLAGTGITLATVGGGCLGDTFPDASATVEIGSVTVTDDPEDKATVTVNGDRATIDGYLWGRTECVTLETAEYASSDGEVIVDITAETTGDDCEAPAAVAYAGEITANFTVNDLRLNHVHDENDRTTVFSYPQGD